MHPVPWYCVMVKQYGTSVLLVAEFTFRKKSWPE